jgi:hypothetical protein
MCSHFLGLAFGTIHALCLVFYSKFWAFDHVIWKTIKSLRRHHCGNVRSAKRIALHVLSPSRLDRTNSILKASKHFHSSDLQNPTSDHKYVSDYVFAENVSKCERYCEVVWRMGLTSSIIVCWMVIKTNWAPILPHYTAKYAPDVYSAMQWIQIKVDDSLSRSFICGRVHQGQQE